MVLFGALDAGSAALAAIAVAAVTGAFTFLGSRHTADTDASLRSDDAAWKRLQQTVADQATDLQEIRASLRQAVEHGERCDLALARASREIAELGRRLDQGERA